MPDASSATSGIFISRIISVMIIAITPSLNASRRLTGIGTFCFSILSAKLKLLRFQRTDKKITNTLPLEALTFYSFSSSTKNYLSIFLDLRGSQTYYFLKEFLNDNHSRTRISFFRQQTQLD